MIQIFQKKNGSVSVFLAIILVPMMLIASIMIDYGRVQLGSAVLSSAGDLALNTALTSYDNVLKDVYGLMATSQNNDELLENLEEYYTKSIIAQGVSKADADDYVGQIMNTLKGVSDTSSTDFMNMEVVTFDVEEPDTASLVNPALLRGQIVNFMKYRAPINGGMSLLESLKSFSNLSKQMELVENKQKYYNEHATLLENCEKAWGYMAKYRELFNKTEDFTEIKNYMNNIENEYKTINSNVIHNYYNNIPTKYFASPTTCYKDDSGQWVFIYDGSQVTKSTYYTDNKNSNYEPDKEDILESLEALIAYMNNIPTFVDIATKYGGEDKYPIQVATWAGLNKESDFKAYKNLYIAYTNFADMYNTLSKDNKEATVEITSNKVGNTVTYSYDIILKNEDDSEEDNEDSNKSNANVTTKKLNEYYNEISNIYQTYMEKLNKGTCTIFWDYAAYEEEYNNVLADTNSKISGIATQVNAYRDKLSQAKSYLEQCNEQLRIIADKVNPNNTSSTLQSALNTWNSSASDSTIKNDAIAQQDKAEIEQMKEFIKYEDVKKLSDRVGNAINEIDKNIQEINKYTYCGSFYGDIDNLNTLVKKLSSAENSALSNLSMVTATLDSLSSDIAVRQIKKGDFKNDWSSDSSKNPIFSVDQYRFYTYLYNNYNQTVSETTEVNSDKTTAAKNDAENKKDSIESLGNDAKEDSKNGNSVSSNSIEKFYEGTTSPSNSEVYKNIVNGVYDIPSISEDSVSKGNTSSGLSSMFSEISKLLKNAAVNLRDYIYIEEYIMNMFSYNTYEKEIINKIDNENSTKIDTNSSEYKSEAKTLTNIPINKNNNYSYLQEVEYIIYGNNGTTKTYATIFGIRLAMNSIYAFTDTELRNSAYAIAASIFSVPPLTPLIPVAQYGILFAVSIAESGLDLQQLKEGKAVPLMKDDNTWCISFSNLVSVIKDEAVKLAEEAVDKIADGVNEKINEWLDYGEEELQNIVNSSENSLNALTQQLSENVEKEIDRYIGVVTNELTTLATKANDMLNYGEDDLGNEITDSNKDSIRLDYIKRNLESWWNEEKSSMDVSTLAYKIEEETVKYLLSSADSEIQNIFNSTKENINDMGESLKENINKLSGYIRKQVNTTCTEINEYTSSLNNALKKAANEGVDKFRDELNNGISNLFGTGKDNNTSLDIDDSNTSTIASMFKFRYSDYLKVFLMVALVANSDTVMGRTSDILEANMSKITGTKFKLANAYTYIKINATVDVKPLLLTTSWFSDMTEANIGGLNYYRVEYNGVGGY